MRNSESKGDFSTGFNVIQGDSNLESSRGLHLSLAQFALYCLTKHLRKSGV